MDRLFVEIVAVASAAMGPETFSVIGCQENQHVVPEPTLLEAVQQATDPVVGVLDLTRVEVGVKAFLSGRLALHICTERETAPLEATVPARREMLDHVGCQRARTRASGFPIPRHGPKRFAHVRRHWRSRNS